jgi:archaeal flagellin N-terminal-like domain
MVFKDRYFMRDYKMQYRSKKGISSILGTVIVLAITIALGALLYAYSQGMFGSLTQNVNVDAQAQIIVNPSTSQAYLQLTLVNDGNVNVNITSVYVNGQRVSNFNPTSILPGQTYQNVYPLKGVYNAGQYYTVIINGKTDVGNTI